MIHLIIAVFWMILAASNFWLLRRRYQSLGTLAEVADHQEHLPGVTVIIPARDEEINIKQCLQGLLAQDYPTDLLQILVVDDNSRDLTAEIASEMAKVNPQLDLIHAPPLPPGWYGKQHACWQGAKHADSAWFCFIDTDTRSSPDLISSAVKNAQADELDLFSIHPRQEMVSFWERLLMPVPMISLMLLMDAESIRDPSRPTAMANGQFILIRRSVYEAIDGHRGVRAAVLEDIEIAKRVKQSGYRIAIRGGGDFIRTRMYRNFQDIWSALARNGSELFGPVLTAFAVVGALITAFFPWLYPLWFGSRIGVNETWMTLTSLTPALIGSLFWYGFHAMAMRVYDVPLSYALLLPLSNLLIGIVILDGLIQRLRGRRTWKGRNI